MIVFTITNNESHEVYVGTARNTAEEKWSQYLASTSAGLDFPLYNDIRDYGSDAFTISEWAFADSLEELTALNREAMQTFDGISLRGHKTVNSSVVLAPQNIDKAVSVSGMVRNRTTVEKKVHSTAAKTVFAMKMNGVGNDVESGADSTSTVIVDDKTSEMIGKVLGKPKAGAKKAASKKKPAAPAKIASGRTGNSVKEKRIKEAIAAEKEAREKAAKSKVAAEADEMAAILSRLESREAGSAAYKNRRR
ncbi:hypothetical protein SIN8267_03329 [Sinobacterium norvegicum]|uniref:GIY-YIG domain-containing protein n=1 Tax=Sinobacterium norvegicum TaxID=1641715 RepID=A0ABN8EQC6_9GAMM|nr:GIY-YIG nuclease family protein [Sinobacterium norvegicum]CAH0993188.1 hypothetical protein SIN8267_03329 [Sinobacterium norvegicum]